MNNAVRGFAPFPDSPGRAMTLVGRDQQLAVLEAAYRDCGPGRGAIVVIRGPVGSGKTALLRAFTGWPAVAGAVLLGAVASRAERGLELGIADQLFRCPAAAAVAAEAAELIDRGRRDSQRDSQPGGSAPQAVSPALAEVFERLLKLLARLASPGPVVVAVDGIQHADLVSLRCLSYLSRRAGAVPLLIVLTECTGTLPADRLLHAEILGQGNCRAIPLGPLPPSGVASLLARPLGAEAGPRLAADGHAMTGGSPLLVTALAEDARTAVAGAVPQPGFVLRPGPAFGSAVVTCLHLYEPGLVELGQAAAALGADATAALLGELLAVSPESAARGLDVLGASGLLESGRFRREEARQAVLGHMTAAERAVLHGAAARALYRTGAPAAILASHIMAAHRIGSRWAVAALREAAEQALAAGEGGRAVEYLMRAEDECADDRQRAAIIFALTRAEWPADPERAARHLPELVATARSGLLGGDCLEELAHYLLWMGDTGSAAEILTAFGAGVAEPDGAGPRLPLRSPLDFLYPDAAGRVRAAVQDAVSPARSVAWSPEASAPPAWPRGASLHPAGDRSEHEAMAAVAEGILAERSLNDPALVCVTTALLGLIGLDAVDRAASWCDMLRRESDASRGSPLWRAVLTGFAAMIDLRRGNLPAAGEQARTALDMLTPKAWGVAIGGPLSSLLLSSVAGRDQEKAAACLRTPVPGAMSGTCYGLLYLYARGEYYLATGRPQAALADFSDCGRRMLAWGLDLPGLIPWRVKSAEAHVALGNHLEARELTREQLARTGVRLSRTRGISLRALALTSHPAKRTALLRESAEMLRDSGARLELAYTFTELSNAHLALGEHGRAHWAARQARNLAERCGARTLANLPDGADADGRGSCPDIGTGAGAGARLLPQLSDAEQRVAMLAAYGYTNGQIARKLYITVSTVEQHLTRVYRKLGVASRAELPIGL
jgi:DNA-binding CsgD family transcriptional regulator